MTAAAPAAYRVADVTEHLELMPVRQTIWNYWYGSPLPNEVGQ